MNEQSLKVNIIEDFGADVTGACGWPCATYSQMLLIVIKNHLRFVSFRQFRCFQVFCTRLLNCTIGTSLVRSRLLRRDTPLGTIMIDGRQ